MLKLFDALQIIPYEIVAAKLDFFHRREMGVLRLVARKPDVQLSKRLPATKPIEFNRVLPEWLAQQKF